MHLVGYFHSCITMHGFMTVKITVWYNSGLWHLPKIQSFRFLDDVLFSGVGKVRLTFGCLALRFCLMLAKLYVMFAADHNWHSTEMFLHSIFLLKRHHLVQPQQTAKREANVKVIKMFYRIMLAAWYLQPGTYSAMKLLSDLLFLYYSI